MNTNQFRSFRGFASVLGVSLALLVFLSGAMFAQETWGSVRGAVTDPSGAAVPNARVEISGGGLPQSLVTATDATGNYQFGQVPPATYSLTVTSTGFQVVKKTSVPVTLGRTTAVDFRMEVGSVNESVVVAADAVMVDTTSSASSTSVEKGFFDVLPRGRNFDSLIAVAPGARPEPKQGGYQIDGASGSENTFYINGMEVTNIQTGVLNAQSKIPFEFVQEVQIKSGGLEAQYGGAIGGAVNAVLRSGTNDFHGQAGLFFATDATNAGPRPSLRLNPNNDDIAEYFHNTRDGYRLLNPAGQIGGPIVRNKMWFLAGYMPQFETTNRDVKFLSGQSGSYERKDRQDFFLGKIDWAATEKIRTQFSYMYNPLKVNGLLPSQQGTSAYSSPWSQLGNRSPASNYTFQADWLASNRLIISGRGGYNYTNYKDYGIPRGTRYRYATSNIGLKDPAGNTLSIPPQYLGATGDFTPNNQQTVLNQYTRFNLNLDATYTFNAAGQHTLKGGWQYNGLANKADASTWPDGYIFMYWGRAWQGITVPGSYRGAYGYYIDRYFSTQGDVSSSNQGIFLQDNWRIGKNLTLNLGLRTEHEFVPSFRTDSGIPSRAIDFPWSKKFAPRVGFAWDPTGVGKWKIYGSWGMFYDVMKFEMPRGSFGGDKWVDKMYTLETGDLSQIAPNKPPASSKYIESVDWRIPSNDPADNTIDPNLKPMRSRLFDMGLEHSISPTLVASARYAHRTLDRTIEDTGTLGPQGEKYFIANPGFGLTADPKTWGKGFPTTPKAVRDYDALELRLDKRFSRSYQFALSYTWSRLFGNYGGLASSDEDGRVSPNVNRYFDLPFMSYDERGQGVYGRLATDRPHTFKVFGNYALNSKFGSTNFAPYFAIFSGTPMTTQVNMVSSVPIFVYGRGDLGRTPVYSQTDLNVYHDFKPVKNHEQMRVRVEATCFNCFNQSAVTSKNTSYVHPNDGQVNFDDQADFFKGFNTKAMIKDQDLRVNPQFGMASAFQGPRTMRFQMMFFF